MTFGCSVTVVDDDDNVTDDVAWVFRKSKGSS